MLRTYLKSLLYILIVMGMTLAGAEGLARTAWVDEHLMLPTYGFNDNNYDVQLDLLAKYHAKHGQIDCIYLGSSQVFRDINPEVVAETYEAETGEALHCFNMGHFGMWTQGAEQLAKYLIATYHPRYLIYGMSPVAFTNNSVFDDALMASDWMTYIDKNEGRKGWLIEHSHAYRYYLRYQNWLDPESITRLEKLEVVANQYTPTGHIPAVFSRDDVNQPPEPKYTPDFPFAHQIEALQFFLDTSQHGSTRVIFVEMPIHRGYPDEYPDKMGGYNEIVEKQILPSGIMFWDTDFARNFPAEFWVDRTHLNRQGSLQFSYWLGIQMAQWHLAGNPTDFTPIEVELPYTRNQENSSSN